MRFPSIIFVNILLKLLDYSYRATFLSFRLDYGFSTTDRLYDYVSARAYGEHEVSLIILYPANVDICDKYIHNNLQKVTLWKRSIDFFLHYREIVTLFTTNAHSRHSG